MLDIFTTAKKVPVKLYSGSYCDESEKIARCGCIGFCGTDNSLYVTGNTDIKVFESSYLYNFTLTVHAYPIFICSSILCY